MVFPTIEFAAFFVVVLLASWLLMPTPKYWKPFIFAASLAFYAAADWRWVFLLLASIVGNQAAATAISRMSAGRARKAVLIGAVAGNLLLLGVFKYLGFFVDSVTGLMSAFGLQGEQQVLELALPVGISFFTFQAISYVVDVYRAKAPLAKPIDTAVYLSFFPHLVAGPIVRATEFIPQLATPRSPRNIPAAPALFLIAGGLIKKVVLADFLAVNLVDPVFGSPQAFGAVDTATAILGYAAQIYCDFSGYTDIAIGLAMLLGFWFPQNFDQPYRALSLQEFWHRWHMTLSRWLRDYLYIPLGGSKKGPRRTYINLMLTMILGGLWHGAAWTFVIWGTMHGSGLAFERWVRERAKQLRSGPTIDLRDEPDGATGAVRRPAPASDHHDGHGQAQAARRRGDPAALPEGGAVAGHVQLRVPGLGVLPGTRRGDCLDGAIATGRRLDHGGHAAEPGGGRRAGGRVQHPGHAAAAVGPGGGAVQQTALLGPGRAVRGVAHRHRHAGRPAGCRPLHLLPVLRWRG